MTSYKHELSVVIPVFNSEDTISSLVDELIRAIGSKMPFEVVLVNDSSPDSSHQKCLALQNAYPQEVTYIDLAKNVGEHNAVMAGLRFTTYENVIIMDDDFQNKVDSIFQILETTKLGNYDVVYTRYISKKHAWYRNLGSWFNGKVATIMLKKPKDLYLSSFKLIRRHIVNDMIQYDHPFPYIDGLVLRATSHIGQVVVEHQERQVGRSNYTLRKLIRLWLNMFTNFSILPLRVSMFAGFFSAVLGVCFAGYTIYEKLKNPGLPVGWATLVICMALFSGIQLIAIGLIGEYLGRLFLSVNKSPQYTIRSSWIAQKK